LAPVVATHCARHLGSERRRYVGRVGCGACWERAIRDDERVVILFDLPGARSADPSHVDEVAVDRACRGKRVGLTPTERVEAVRRLTASGLGTGAVGERLGLSGITVRTIRAGLVEAVPFLSASPEPTLGTDAAVA
jgi:hypothetical protein